MPSVPDVGVRRSAGGADAADPSPERILHIFGRIRTGMYRLWPWCAALATAILYGLSLPPCDQPWLGWICLTPLTAAVWFSKPRGRHVWLHNFLLGYVAGLCFFTITFNWLGQLGTLFDNIWLRGLPLLLSLYLGLHFGFWAWVIGLIRPKNFVTSWRNLFVALLAAAAWVTHDWVRGWLFGGFGWNGLGVTQHGNWLLIQIAEFTGIAGLSFVVATANVIALTLPFRLFQEARTHRMHPHWDLNLTVLAVVGLLVYGWNAVQQSGPTRNLRVAAIEPNIPQQEKLAHVLTSRVVEQLVRLSRPALQMSPAPQLLVWPEGATAEPLFTDEQTYRAVTDFAATARVDLLLGSDVLEEDRAYNAAVLVPASGADLQVYRKIHLVPFGEYVPLRHSFPLFAAVAGRWVPGDFAIGKEYTLFRLTNSNLRVAPLICFEDTIGELTRRFVANGADVLINITNDGWFLHSAGSRQHLANAIFRCVETRRPLVRAANTGVTCFVNRYGRIVQVLRGDNGSTFTEGALVGDVDIPLSNEKTFYVRHGELFAECCAGVTLIGIVLSLLLGRRAANTISAV